MAAVGMKRKGAASQEQQQFHRKRQMVPEAERLLTHRPVKRCKDWERKAQEARKMLAEARQTRCFFDLQGGCRDGHDCMFMHSSDPAETRGRISKWKPEAPNGAFAFVDIGGEELFAPARSFAGGEH